MIAAVTSPLFDIERLPRFHATPVRQNSYSEFPTVSGKLSFRICSLLVIITVLPVGKPLVRVSYGLWKLIQSGLELGSLSLHSLTAK